MSDQALLPSFDCNHKKRPRRYWRVGAQETGGLQPQSQPQGARTPDWPAQPATKPRAPRTEPPSGTRHTRAR